MRTTATAALAAAILCGMFITTTHAAEPKMTESPYAQWTHGPSTDPSFFPIGVWAQNPRDAGKYKAIGVNTFMALHGGPTEKQLADLKKVGMKAICHQNAVGLAHKDESTIIAWMHGDEPDNFTKDKETGKYVPKQSAASVIADYKRIAKTDTSRPVLLNLGQGVANDQWKGGWAKPKDYRQFVKGCDIVSFDIYPACSSKPNVAGKLEIVPLGVDRLHDYSNGKAIVWNILECTRISNPKKKATPAEVRSEVWMSLIHGSKGIVYFCHDFVNAAGERKVVSNALLQDSVMSKAVGEINAQVMELAPVLNAPTVKDGAEATPTSPEGKIDVMVKKLDGAVYVFAVNMTPKPTLATITVNDVPAAATAEEIGSGKTLAVRNGVFRHAFGRYGVRVYKIAP